MDVRSAQSIAFQLGVGFARDCISALEINKFPRVVSALFTSNNELRPRDPGDRATGIVPCSVEGRSESFRAFPRIPVASSEIDAFAQFPSSRPFVDFCVHSTRQACSSAASTSIAHAQCRRVHFEQALRPHTEVSLGDCSYLNTCHRMDTCRYVHWTLEDPGPTANPLSSPESRQLEKGKTKQVRSLHYAIENDTERDISYPRSGSTPTCDTWMFLGWESSTLWLLIRHGRSIKRCVVT